MSKRFVLAAFFCVCMAVPWPGSADSLLFISPTRIKLSDQDRVVVVNVTNKSEKNKQYKIRMADVIMDETGTTKDADDFEFSAKRLIRFSPRQITVPAGSSQSLRVMARIPGDLPDGDYHAHMMFVEDYNKTIEMNKPPSGQVGAVAGIAHEIGIPVFLSHGDVQVQIGMTGAKLGISDQPNKGAYMVDLTLTRAGNGNGVAYIDTDYISPNGMVVKATPRRTVQIYREVDHRKRVYYFTLPENTKLESGGELRISLFDDPKQDAKPIKQISLETTL